MTHEERSLIRDLEKCDFGEIHAMHKAKVEAKKNMTKEEKLVGFTPLFWILHTVTVCKIQHCTDQSGLIVPCFVGFERGQPEGS